MRDNPSAVNAVDCRQWFRTQEACLVSMFALHVRISAVFQAKYALSLDGGAHVTRVGGTRKGQGQLASWAEPQPEATLEPCLDTFHSSHQHTYPTFSF